MELVERYLEMLGSHLPGKERDDILRELSENLRSQIEDREAELGRSLTEDEVRAMLTRLGHPAIVAGRYRPHQGSLVLGRQLIGPELFPFYVRILAVTLGATLIACMIVLGALPGARTPGQIVLGTLVNLAIQLVVVSAIFILVQRHVVRHPEEWDAKALRARRRRAERRASRPQLVIELVGLVITALWWWWLPANLGPFVRTAGEWLTSGPIWSFLYRSLLALTVAHIAVTAFSIARPERWRVRAGALAVLHLAGAAVGFTSANLGGWVLARGTDPEMLGKIATLNHLISVGVTWFAAVNLAIAAVQIWRLTRSRPLPAAASVAI